MFTSDDIGGPSSKGAFEVSKEPSTTQRLRLGKPYLLYLRFHATLSSADKPEKAKWDVRKGKSNGLGLAGGAELSKAKESIEGESAWR